METWINSLSDRKSLSVYGINIMQNWRELFFINTLLQYEQFDNIIELGSGAGAGTLFLSLASQGTPVHGFDLRPEPVHEMWSRLKQVFPITYYNMDVFKDETRETIRDLLKQGHSLLYCDDGDKPREFKTYSRYLMRHDVIMAHDKDVEITLEDVQQDVWKQGLTPYHQEEADSYGAKILCFRKTH